MPALGGAALALPTLPASPLQTVLSPIPVLSSDAVPSVSPPASPRSDRPIPALIPAGTLRILQ